MELSAEDSLRLNVMLANAVAVKVDEGTMTVHCLSKDRHEGRVQLNPNCRPDQYIRRVRELLSSHVLGSPGGYPVYLKRWTRMGQTSDSRLSDLLMLGEPEAVVAVAVAPALTDELARLCWWCMSDAANARCMLSRDAVATGDMGRELAEFLLEFLPFEEEPRDVIDSVRLVLQPGLISEQEMLSIWQRGRSKVVFRIGFLQAIPDALPEPVPERADYPRLAPALEALAENNRYARQLMRLLSGAGQTWLQTARAAAKKPANQDVIVKLLDTVAEYMAAVRESRLEFETIEAIESMIDAGGPEHDELGAEYQACLEAMPALAEELRVMRLLAHIGEPQLRPVFARTDAIGSVMRKKISHIVDPVIAQLDILSRATVN
jgi:hypothetical protein